jgi:alpha-N-arabinofuranosidase
MPPRRSRWPPTRAGSNTVRADPSPRPLGKLSVLFDGPGGCGSTRLADAGRRAGRRRRDVFEKVKALRPASSAGQAATWRRTTTGVGDRPSRRAAELDRLAWANEIEPGTSAPTKCGSARASARRHPRRQRRGARATAERRRPGSNTSTVRPLPWGRRAALGHPRPYGVRLWELGEIWGDWVRGHSDALTYARNYLRYQAAMKPVDPPSSSSRSATTTWTGTARC